MEFALHIANSLSGGEFVREARNVPEDVVARFPGGLKHTSLLYVALALGSLGYVLDRERSPYTYLNGLPTKMCYFKKRQKS